MNDKQYIAKLESLLEERKDLIKELITICEDLVKERDELAELLDQCETDYENMRDNYEQSCDRFDDLMKDYEGLKDHGNDICREKRELEKNVVKLEGMVERRDKKIKDLTVERDIIKGACEDCDYGNELLAENEELKEKVNAFANENKHLREEVKHLNAIVDGENA